MTQIHTTGHFLLSSPEFMGRVAAECLSWPKAKADALLESAPPESDKPWSLSFRIARYAAKLATTMERSAYREEKYQAEKSANSSDASSGQDQRPDDSGGY